jgi:hypothetical protein
MMNVKQRAVLAVALVLLFLTALFPPWRFDVPSVTDRGTAYSDRFAGYGFVLAPPTNAAVVDRGVLRVDAGLLLVEVVAITCLAGLAMLLLGRAP